jgi:cytochrome P450
MLKMSKQNLKLAPGPKNSTLIGQLPNYLKNPRQFFAECVAQYGDIVSIHPPTGRAYLVNDPIYIKEILTTNAKNFIKPPFYHVNDGIMGNGLFTSEGDFWRRQHRLAMGAFHPTRLNTYADIMVNAGSEVATTLLTKLKSQPQYSAADSSNAFGGTQNSKMLVDVHDLMMTLALQIITRALFGAELGEAAHKAREAFDIAFAESNKRLNKPIRVPEKIPTPGNLRYNRNVAKLDEIIYGFIYERQQQKAPTFAGNIGSPANVDNATESSKDLLTMLVNARDETTNEQMSEKQLRDEIMTFFFAGHETTALSLTWIWYLLAKHPEAEHKLVEELTQTLQGRTPTVADIHHLPYTIMVIQEMLRLYPPAWFFGRSAVEACKIGEYDLPAGGQIWIVPWLTQRDARYYKDPDQFIPERWSQNLKHSQDTNSNLINNKTYQSFYPNDFTYFPFGGGQRQCIGSNFALMNITLLVATLVPRLKFELTPNQPEPKVVPLGTMRPRDPVNLLLSQR